MKVAKAKGHLRGKQPKLNHRQEAHLVALLETGEYTTAELADLFSVGRSTVYRAVERERGLKASAPPISTPRGEKTDTGVPVPIGNAPAGTVHLSGKRSCVTVTGSRNGILL